MVKFRDTVIHEGSVKEESNIAKYIFSLWYVIMSFVLWFNLTSTTFLILWPELGEDNKTLYYVLWLNEFMWLLDILRKLFDKPKKHAHMDFYDHVISYFKSYFILDLISTLPQSASGLSPRFLPLKMIRIYSIWLLHYPFEALVNVCSRSTDQRFRYVVVYAFSTVCKILLMLHFLALIWIWIGSESFADFEPGYKPWLLSIEDFEGYRKD